MEYCSLYKPIDLLWCSSGAVSTRSFAISATQLLTQCLPLYKPVKGKLTCLLLSGELCGGGLNKLCHWDDLGGGLKKVKRDAP